MSKIKYGLYYYNTENIGDEIQSIAARRFLPKVDYYIDRDNINATKIPKDEAVKLIMNGWYTHKPENWPPKSKNLKPLLMSMHINPYSETTLNKFKTTESLNFLKNHSPVGARDLTTLNYLGSIGIETYFSGCLTLTLKADRNIKRKNRILVVDVSDEIYETMKKHTDTEIIRLDTFRLQNMSISEKMALAEYYLYLYQSAKAVVTSRLHCMLPCLALETPVLTIIKKEPERYAGLIELSHHMTEQEYLKNANSYDLHTPPRTHLYIKNTAKLYVKHAKTLLVLIVKNHSWMARN